MSKKKKQKKQSIVISIISTIILLGIILLGSNFNKTEEFNNFIKANNLIENQTEGNLENNFLLSNIITLSMFVCIYHLKTCLFSAFPQCTY